MSQLNLKQILSSDNLSIVMEKINYNFDQIILNGGGPQGLRGIFGAPGIPGQQGEVGATGPIGEEGTHLYTDTLAPNVYPFGTGGEILPRTGDVFVEAQSTYISVWQLSPTGASGNYWELIDTMVSPGGGISKIVHDNSPAYVSATGSSASWDRITNDPSISGKFLFGSPEALYGTGASGNLTILDTGYGPINSTNPGEPRIAYELSSYYPYGDSLMTIASGANQLRILTSDADNTTRTFDGGGLVHSLEKPSGATVQTYKILNADTYGNKKFVLSLNSYSGVLPTLLYGDLQNRLGTGVAENTSLLASFTVGGTANSGSIAVGRASTNFFLASGGAVLNGGIGAIIEGNLAIGKNNNSYATGGFYNNPNAPGGGANSYGAKLVVDTDISSTFSSAATELYFGTNIYTGLGTGSYWRFKHDAYTLSNNYQKLIVKGEFKGKGGYSWYRDSMTFDLEKSGSGLFSVAGTKIGVDNTDPTAMFEVGNGLSNRVAIGNASGGASASYIHSYIGFNMLRNPIGTVDNWTRKGNGAQNTGRAIWTNPYGGIAFSFFGTTGTGDVTGITDQDVYLHTRTYFDVDGSLWLNEKNYATTGTAETLKNLFSTNTKPGFMTDWGPSGSTGVGPSGFRRPVAILGNGPVKGMLGTPSIHANFGLTQSTSTGLGYEIGPQYTFYGNENTGVFLSQGTTANNPAGNGVSTGFAVNGQPVLVATNAPTYPGGRKVGINTRDPHEALQIGDLLTVHDGGVKYIGYNVYYDGSSSRRMTGASGATAVQVGGAALVYSSQTAQFSGSGANVNMSTTNQFKRPGVTMSLETLPIGASTAPYSNVSYTPSGGSTLYPALFVKPPARERTDASGNNISGWSNVARSTPQVSIGMSTDADSVFTLKRGTLSIPAQFRVKPASAAAPAVGPFGLAIEDQYNIGLYNHTGNPVAALYASGGNSNTDTHRAVGINLIGTGGNVTAQDIPVLYASSEINLNNAYQRIANFGTGFRLGVNIVPQDIPTPITTNTHFDVASIVAAGYSEGVPQSVMQAAIFKGSVVIDQSLYSPGNGGNLSLVFKDNTIVTGFNTDGGTINRPNVKNYFGDWAVQYWKVDSAQAGLNFWKPAGVPGGGSNAILYLDDNGSVGIGTTNFNFTTGMNGANNASVMSQGYAAGQPGSADVIATQYWSAVAYVNSVPAPYVSGPVNNKTWRAKFAVDGITKQVGLINISDRRFKNELARLKDGQALERILKLDPVLYEWKGDYHPEIAGKIELGLFAQEVAEIIPEAVSITTTSNFEDEHTLEYNAVFTTMIGAIKDLNAIVEEKDAKIKNLEDKLSKIEELLAKNGIQ